MRSQDSGSFGSPRLNRVDCGQAILSKALEAFDHLVPQAAYDCERGVAEDSEHLWGRTSMGGCLVFAARDVADVMETVLDPQCARANASNFSGPACLAVKLVIAWTASTAFLPRTMRSRVIWQTCATAPSRRRAGVQRPGRLDLAALNPAMAFSTVSARRSQPVETTRLRGGTPGRPRRYLLSGQAVCP